MSRWRKLRRAGCLLAVLAVALEVALRLTPIPPALASGLAPSTEFLDRNGQTLRTLLVEEKRFSRTCQLSEISPQLVAATLSAEDKRFWSHIGVDPIANAHALFHAGHSGKITSGASTITQQLIKLATPAERTFQTKLKEVWHALALERAWSKERIIEEYFNRLDYGNLQVGIASASRYYFNKPPSDLSPAEAAFLAGLPKAPSRLDPHSHLEDARNRQHWVLGRMREEGYIDAPTLERALREPLRIQPPGRQFEAPHFVDLLLQRRGISDGGGRVETTLDLALNRFVEDAIASQLRKIEDKHATAAAAVVIHNPTGDVLALAGSGDYFQPGTGQTNGAWMIRSPGSAVKPFTYLLALEQGANPCTVVADVSSEFPTETGVYRPNNYNHLFYGPVSLRFALGNSLNVGAIRALELGGGPEALYRRLCALGITTFGHPVEEYGLGLTLGNGEVRLLELTNAFAAIGRLGMFQPFRLLRRESADGPRAVRVCDERATYLVADMLADNTARAASFGLNSFLSFPFPVACKTGTSSDYRDNWTIGTTPEFTVGVWVGNPDGKPMRGITGVTGAAPILHDIFMHLHAQRGTSWFTAPKGLLDQRIDPLTGHLAPQDRVGTLTEKCLWPAPPITPSDYDSLGRVILPPVYAQWLASPQNSLGSLVSAGHKAAPLRIVSPTPGTLYYLDPDLPSESQWISLRGEGNGDLAWSSDSLRCETANDRVRVQLREGRHVIIAREPGKEHTAETWIEVKAL